jgi:hypothetical protein
VTATKQKKRTRKAVLQTSADVPSLPSAAANYLLEKINPEDLEKLWLGLRECAKAADRPTALGIWANGTISGADCQAVVTAFITHAGFVLHFTAKGT